jgi:hypothetical protein
MDIIKLMDLEYLDTNLEDDTTPLWLNTAGYNIDTIRRIDKKLYKALDLIEPLATYTYDNTDLLNPDTVIDILTDNKLDNTSVSCVENITVVYIKDTNSFVLFVGNTGDIDFTSTDFNDSNTWTAIDNYRYEIYDPTKTPTKWEDLGFTNKYKCLDGSLSSQTQSDTDITMSFIVNKFDNIHLFNMFAENITVSIYNLADNSLLFNETIIMSSKNGGTFFNYFFNDFTYVNKAYFNIPFIWSARVEITIKAFGDTAKVGLIGIGRTYNIGATLYGASLGLIDYSKKVDNSIGETYLEVGNYKSKNDLTIDVNTARIDEVYDLLADLRATPIIFKGSENYKSLHLFGIYKDYSILLNTPIMSRINIQIESLI